MRKNIESLHIHHEALTEIEHTHTICLKYYTTQQLFYCDYL